jgi:DNA-binding NarL/FixJ family response regulator
MLVDDNPTFLRVATTFLEENSHGELDIVGAAHGGEEALALAQALQPHVVLLDLAMPGLSGMETAPRLHQALPAVGIIALTVFGSERYRQAALTAGADDFVSKTALITDLLPTIRRVAQAKQVERP